MHPCAVSYCNVKNVNQYMTCYLLQNIFCREFAGTIESHYFREIEMCYFWEIQICHLGKLINNINEVIRAVLDFFIQKFYKHKKHETLTSGKKKKKKKRMLLKNIYGKKSHLFAFCAFTWVSLYLLVLLFFLMRVKSFGKKNKEFKTALITSFILFLKFMLLQAWIL